MASATDLLKTYNENCTCLTVEWSVATVPVLILCINWGYAVMGLILTWAAKSTRILENEDSSICSHFSLGRRVNPAMLEVS